MDSLGTRLNELDAEANRTRTTHADNLRSLTSQGLDRRRLLQDAFASQGMTHSGANLRSQTNLAREVDNQQARLESQMQDRLANIAKERISAETQFNINSLIPR